MRDVSWMPIAQGNAQVVGRNGEKIAQLSLESEGYQAQDSHGFSRILGELCVFTWPLRQVLWLNEKEPAFGTSELNCDCSKWVCPKVG